MKRTPGQHTGRLVDWILAHILQLIWVAFALYGLYSVNALVNYVELIGERFYSFTSYIRAETEARKQLPGTPSELPNTDG